MQKLRIMDYKYIEQLLEAYWECRTNVEEERILKAFFLQKEILEHLMKYRSLFCSYEAEKKQATLGHDFDKRIMEKIGQPTVKAQRITLMQRLRPLYQAAAIIAIILTVGGAVERSLQNMEQNNPPEAESTPQQGVLCEDSLKKEKPIKAMPQAFVSHTTDSSTHKK